MKILFAFSLLLMGSQACTTSFNISSDNVCVNSTFPFYLLCIRVPREHLMNLEVSNYRDNHIKITHTLIKPLASEMTAQFENLPFVTIENTDLDAIPAGAFNNLTRLLDLALNRNCLTTIPAGAFPASMRKLWAVHLRDNQITTIAPNAFSAPMLRKIYLTRNNLTNLDGIFDSVPGLRMLHLRYNKLQSLGRNSFKDLTLLKRVFLSGNPIQHISDDAFADLDSLKILDLKNTGLVSADWIVRAPNNEALRRVKRLYLQDNSLQTLPNTTFSTLTNIEEFGIARNPWNCNDQLGFLITEIGRRPSVVCYYTGGGLTSTPYCSEPPNRSGQKLANVSGCP